MDSPQALKKFQVDRADEREPVTQITHNKISILRKKIEFVIMNANSYSAISLTIDQNFTRGTVVKRGDTPKERGFDSHLGMVLCYIIFPRAEKIRVRWG